MTGDRTAAAHSPPGERHQYDAADGRWNNLGAPVVAYYSPGELEEIVAEADGRVIRRRDRTARVRRLPRLLGVRGRWFTTVMAVRVRGFTDLPSP